MKYSLTAVAALLLGAAVAMPTVAHARVTQHSQARAIHTMQTGQTAVTPTKQPRKHMARLQTRKMRLAQQKRHLRTMNRLAAAHPMHARTTHRIAATHRTTVPNTTAGVGSSTPPTSNPSIPPIAPTPTPAPTNAGGNTTNGQNSAQ